MELKSYDYRDPGELVDAVAARYDMTRQAAYLAVVEDPPGAQRLVYLKRLRAPAVLDDWEAACEELRERLEAAPIPTIGPPGERGGPRHSATVVVVRRGLCVAGPNEGNWARAWRYVNTLAWTFTGGIIVVTPHGWYDLTTHWGAHQPALRSSREPRARLRAV